MNMLLFPEFVGREKALRGVTRYSMYSPMFYRTNLWTHAKHVQWLMMAVAPFAKEVFGNRFDEEKAVAMAAVHDDHEIVLGDFQFGNKLLLTADQAQELRQQEIASIQETARRFPEFAGKYCYKELLLSALHLDCLEAEVLKFVDKYAAFGEALHELFAGNIVFATPTQTEYGCPPTPFQSYKIWLTAYPEKFPRMLPLTQTAFPLFAIVEPLDELAVARVGVPHTETSLRRATGYHHYDAWKEILLQHATGEEYQQLFTQKEYV